MKRSVTFLTLEFVVLNGTVINEGRLLLFSCVFIYWNQNKNAQKQVYFCQHRPTLNAKSTSSRHPSGCLSFRPKLVHNHFKVSVCSQAACRGCRPHPRCPPRSPQVAQCLWQRRHCQIRAAKFTLCHVCQAAAVQSRWEGGGHRRRREDSV